MFCFSQDLYENLQYYVDTAFPVDKIKFYLSIYLSQNNATQSFTLYANVPTQAQMYAVDRLNIAYCVGIHAKRYGSTIDS